ncbi:MAG: hypothetical protein PF448_06010 [Bacteroidales bacterium]|jgi:hypothetical protein|nr:hypothetical protein [Bacteroidales bacterium]
MIDKEILKLPIAVPNLLRKVNADITAKQAYKTTCAEALEASESMRHFDV